MAAKMPPKQLPNNQYFPGAGDVQIGTSSSKTLGSQPIFAASNLIPFGMLDEMKRAQAEQELAYYKDLKTEFDKPLVDAKIKLNSVWQQPEFATKIQNQVDQMLDGYASRLGGNYMQAQVALAHDRNFQRTMQGYAEYANAYNKVFNDAFNIVQKASEPSKYFVPDEELVAARKVIDNHDKLGELSIESLLKNQREFVFKDSLFTMVEAATKGVQEQVYDEYKQNKETAAMSTPDTKIFERIRTYGSKDQIKSIVDGIIKETPEYGSERDLLTSLVGNHIKHGVEKTIERITSENAARNNELRKNGVKVNENGTIDLGTKHSAVIDADGVNAINYPDKPPMPSPSGLIGFINYQGHIRRIRLDKSYDMILNSEYDLPKDRSGNIPPARYIESTIDFKSTEPYDYQKTMGAKNSAGIPYTINIGDTKGQTQIKEATVYDASSGEEIKLMGPVTLLVPEDYLNTTVEANIPYMKDVHDQLKIQGKNNYGLIPLTDDITPDKIISYRKYLRNGKEYFGYELIDKMNNKPITTKPTMPSLINTLKK
jgi:hypothetical protein